MFNVLHADEAALLAELRQSVQLNFGDYGAAVASTSLLGTHQKLHVCMPFLDQGTLL